MKKKMTIDGNEACSYTSYFFTELAGIYPITPSSPMAEHMEEWSNKGRLNIFGDTVKVIEMQSEAGAAGLIHGSLQGGALSATFTASQGLLLMIPNMYKMAGEMLPCVMHVAARSLSTHALSIFGDHQDIYATRSTGFCMLASSNVQDCAYLSGIAHLSSIKASLPFMHFFDGFRTSHEIDKVDVLELEDFKKLVDIDALNKFKSRALTVNKKVTRGTAQNDDIYFQATEARNKFYEVVPDIVNDYMEKINKEYDTDYHPFNYYGDNSAKNIIIAMGSVCDTIKETIDYMNKLGKKVGMVEVHLYRPFSSTYLKNVIPSSVKNIAVLDRTKEFGSSGEPLYLDVKSALDGYNIVGGRYGLSSKNTTPSDIYSVYEMLEGKLKNNFTIGIVDDVTNLSLEKSNLEKINNSKEMLFYGYGSDGMVSASKSIIKLIGDNTNNYVQGYFQYDSKKSGGVTISHLRVSDELIKSTYYVENPSLVVVSKESYLKSFDCISNIMENGTFILNASSDDLEKKLPKKVIDIVNKKNINFYVIDAYKLAKEYNLGNKISMIMEVAILECMNIFTKEQIYDDIEKYIKKKFFKKGEEVINSNIGAIHDVEKYLTKINLNATIKEEKENNNKTLIDLMFERRGNEIPVSKFVSNADGSYEGGTSKLEERFSTEVVPSWISSNCINCNQCSFVCPHGVIRTYLLNKDEYDAAPEIIKNRCMEAIGKKDMYFAIGISIKDCTGCGLCIKTCPGKMNNKALTIENVDVQIKNKEQEIFDYLNNNITDKGNTNVVKETQFIKPTFEFPGACAGCGEVGYIKFLSQLFKDRLIIANATGCSSIYGGSLPSLPYNMPWASSLFEDNAEYGYGILKAHQNMKEHIKNIMLKYDDELFTKWINNSNDYEITKEVRDNIDFNKYKELEEYKDYLVKESIWLVGGDGWAYDIGFSGIDHVLSSNDNINILVLDTQVYSNTGGQASKSTQLGAVALFASHGKKTAKKDLARIALSYKNAYVAQVNLGSNMNQLLKALKEADNHNGPSIVIAYAPCISHGIKGGMNCSLELQKLATNCGYFPIFRYNPDSDKFTLDSKNVDFNLYDEFLNNQTRYSILDKINSEESEELLKNNKDNAINRFKYYESLEK